MAHHRETKSAVFLIHPYSVSILTSKSNSLLNNGLKDLSFQEKQAVNPDDYQSSVFVHYVCVYQLPSCIAIWQSTTLPD